MTNSNRTIIPNYRRDINTNTIISVPIVQTDYINPLSPIITLWEIPTEFDGVQVQNEDLTYKIRVFNADEIINSTYFYVKGQDVYFHISEVGKKVIMSYQGCGSQKFSSSLVYTKVDDEGNISELLSDVIDGGKDAIEAISTLGSAVEIINELDTTIVQANSDKNNIIDSIGAKITEGEIIVTNIETAITNGDISNVKLDIASINSSLTDIPNQTFVTEKAKIVDLNTTNNIVASNYTTLDTKINSQASGSPKGTYATVSELTIAYPTGNSNIYVVTADGTWRYWNGTIWTSGGVYQSTGIINKSITPQKTSFFISGKNLFNKITATSGYYITYTTGELSALSGYYASDYIQVSANTQYSFTSDAVIKIAFYDGTKTYISGLSTPASPITTPTNALYVRYSFTSATINTQQFELGSVGTTYEAYYSPYFDINNVKINSIPSEKISDINISKVVGQVEAKKTNFVESVDSTILVNLLDTNVVTKHADNYYDSAGNLITTINTYDCYAIALQPRTYTITVSAGKLFRVQLYSGVPSSSTFVSTVTNTNTSATFTATAGQYIGITVTSVHATEGATTFTLSYVEPEVSLQIPKLIVTSENIGNILDKIDNKIHITHTKTTTRSSFIIYKQCNYGDGIYYLGTEFYNEVVPFDINNIVSNANVWHLGQVNLYLKNGDVFTQQANTTFILAGEWECALKEFGASDFVGGNAHGDENYTDFVAILDGKILDTTTSYGLSGNRLEILCNSILNRVSTPNDNIAEHNKLYIITKEGIELSQRVKWLQVLTMDKSYMTMLPTTRSIGGVYVTNKGFRNNTYAIEDLSEGHTLSYTKNTNRVTEYNSDLGHQFTCSVEFPVTSPLPNSDVFISNSTSPLYNKIYYDYCGSGYVTTVGEEWKLKTIFKYDYMGVKA